MNVTPKIIHQTWKTHTLPPQLAKYAKTCRDVNKTYKYILYDDNDLRNVILNNYPQYLEKYDSFDNNIERVDFARYAILHKYGGVYADLDMECFKSFDEHVGMNRPVFGSEPVEHREKLYENRKIVICNAMMFSPPGDPLWIHVMDFASRNYKRGANPVFNTGPMMLTLLYESNPRVFSNAQIVSACAFYAQSDRFTNTVQMGIPYVSRECNLNITPPVAVHRWAHTWIPGESSHKNDAVYYIGAIALICILGAAVMKAT